jgi:hypothetical protein
MIRRNNTIMNENTYTEVQLSAKHYIILALVTLGLLLIGFAMGVKYEQARSVTVETIPETEVVETTDGTTAPETDPTVIVPTTEETIPTEPEETVPETTVPEETKPVETKPAETKPATTEKPTVVVTDDGVELSIAPPTNELEMLACVIYQEAGGSQHCDECRRRVGDIVLNRVADKRYPNTIEEVLLQKRQYGKFSTTGIKWPSRSTSPNERRAVIRSYRAAQEILSGQHSDVYGKGYIYQATFKQGKEQFYCCGHWFGRS